MVVNYDKNSSKRNNKAFTNLLSLLSLKDDTKSPLGIVRRVKIDMLQLDVTSYLGALENVDMANDVNDLVSSRNC